MFGIIVGSGKTLWSADSDVQNVVSAKDLSEWLVLDFVPLLPLCGLLFAEALTPIRVQH